MAKKTGISWTMRTWNPMVGCAIASPGCRHCYAMSQAHWIAAQGGKPGAKYDGLTEVVNGRPVWNGVVRLADAATVGLPARLGKPELIFVNSMSDFFAEGLGEEDIFRVLDVMMAADRHVYQVLTKRASRMADVLERYAAARGIERFEHVWFGVSVEDRRRAEERMPELARIPARVRFVSAEPLLERIDLDGLPAPEWLIVGGESATREMRSRGETARLFDPDWARDLRDWCARNGVAFYMKQLGDNPVGERVKGKGDDLAVIPADLRIRDYPAALPSA